MRVVTVEGVMEALKSVMDPEIRRNIVDLGMVREVEVRGSHVEVTVALTVPDCPLQGTIARDAREAVEALGEELDVEVALTSMTPEEKKQMIERLRRERRPAPRPQAAEGPDPQGNSVGSVIAVMSGKGGVGKSTVASLLAAGLQRKGLRVGVLDADITGPSIPKLFGVDAKPMATSQGIEPPESRTGVKIMSINLLLDTQDDAVVWRGPLIAGAIQQFWNDVDWGELDVLVVDMPPGTSDAALTVMQSLPVSGVVLVTSPQQLADMVVRKAAKMAAHMETPIIGIVENMSYAICPHCRERHAIFGEGHPERMAEAFDTEFLGRLGIDPELTRLADAGQVEAYADEDVAALVERVESEVEA
jgi:Mrp family chromosome partitioning ATPase